MKRLERKRADRDVNFEERVRKMAGKSFDEEVFRTMREKRASINTILEASARGEGKKRRKSTGDNHQDVIGGGLLKVEREPQRREVIAPQEGGAETGRSAGTEGGGKDHRSGGRTTSQENPAGGDEDTGEEEEDVSDDIPTPLGSDSDESEDGGERTSMTAPPAEEELPAVDTDVKPVEEPDASGA